MVKQGIAECIVLLMYVPALPVVVSVLLTKKEAQVKIHID
jgi:hypothetical protein